MTSSRWRHKTASSFKRNPGWVSAWTLPKFYTNRHAC